MSHNESNQNTDASLLLLMEKGNKQAFDKLFEKYWQQTYSDAYKQLKCRDDAKDIVQEIFTHIWINRESKHIENLAAYLKVAVRNKVIKLVSKQKNNHPFFDILENIPNENYSADSELLWKEFTKSYNALVKSLPPKRQEIFRLRFHEDMRTKDIAEQLEISLKTVQGQLKKAVETLRVSIFTLFH